MAPPDLVLGLDSGGTKTLLAVADRNGGVLWEQRGPSLDPFTEPDWPGHLATLLRSCEPWRHRLDGAALGLSCHGEVAAVSARQVAVAAGALAVPHLVLNDVRVAFDGALAGRAGVLLLAGTGSMAWAGDGRCRDTRVGGWGSTFGDEGSAHWIGREALSMATCALDGRSGDRVFAGRLLDALRLSAGDVLTTFLASTNARAAVASVAKAVDGIAEAGNATALALLRRAADHVADHAGAARAKLGLPDDSAWSFAGSVFASRTVMAQVARRLGRDADPPRLPPVGGALLRAAQFRGWAVDDGWIDRLRNSLSAGQRPEIFTGSAQEGPPR